MKRHYIVTGGGSGLGLAVATRLAAKGDHVHIWGRNLDKLNAVIAAGHANQASSVNLADPDQVETALSQVLESGQEIAGFIHCAGVWTPGKLDETSAQAIGDHIQAMIIGTTFALRAAVSLFKAQGHGKILQIAAASAKNGFADTALNTLAKRAQDGLQEGLTRELVGTGIFMTTVYPDSISKPESNSTLTGRAISYGDLAEIICWLLEAPASAFVQEVLVTGKTGHR